MAMAPMMSKKGTWTCTKSALVEAGLWCSPSFVCPQGEKGLTCAQHHRFNYQQVENSQCRHRTACSPSWET
eukprot:1175351-Amphidinium_carterae.1